MAINFFKIFFLSVVAFLLFLYSNNNEEASFYSLLGIFFFFNLLYDFFSRLGDSFPIRSLMLLIAFIQWIIAPFFSYHYFSDSLIYQMQVPEDQYMSYIVPATLAFYLGLKIKLRSNENVYEYLYERSFNDVILKKRGIFLYFVGLLSLFLIPFAPGGFAFAFFLLSKLHMIGALYLFACGIRFKYLWLFSAFLPILVSAATSTIFHDLLLWGGFIFVVYAFFKRIGAMRKVVLFGGGVLFIMFIQYIKSDYRSALQSSAISAVSQSESGAELMLELADKRLKEEGVTSEYFQGLVDRLNQGWIIARIIYVVPDFEPFAEGETIEKGIKAALVPRIFSPGKVQSGGAYFKKFTGLTLLGTSMNISLVGEAYANYGINGGIWFMLIIGLFFNLALYILHRYARKYYEVLLWIPFLFLYVVKAEDDFSTMFNQFIKSVFICYLMFFVLKQLYPRNKQVED